MSRLLDISPPITEAIAVWPGDVPYRRRVGLDMAAGDNLTLSAIETTVHVGAHADGPNHYRVDGVGIGERPLEPYYGPCEVIAVQVERGARISARVLDGRHLRAARVLFRTETFPDPNRFNEDFASLSAGLVDALAAQGVILVGIDTPSIDPCDDAALESHQAVARHDMAVLEGLVLSAVTPGCYTLVALPLRLMGADASPVRAVLVEG